MSDDYYAVIMAGGGGTRLWPLSRRSRPKQALRLVGDRTLFQMAVDRLGPLFPSERIFVITVGEQAEELQAQAPQLPAANFILEPSQRGTASVIGLAAVLLSERHASPVMACLTADHFIGQAERFRTYLAAAYDLALEGDLVTLGITPTYPATGYGYIQRGEPRGIFGGSPAYRVKAFEEKPDAERAQAFVSSREYAWNSGMFVWRTGNILAEIDRQMPALAEGLRLIGRASEGADRRRATNDVWAGLKSQTIDFGIMEGARNVSMIAADDLGWWDIGSWARLFDVLPGDTSGNVVQAESAVLRDTQRTLVYQVPGGSPRLIATLGVEDLVIVDAGDALLVCRRERAEDVRRLVEWLASSGGEQYV